MTHADLVAVAERWLRNNQRCKAVATVACIMTNENPDAIGWKAGGWSVMVECKISRSDFRKDLKKWHRAGVGCGWRRYYLTPPDLVKPGEIPDGWGLLYAAGRSVHVVKVAPDRPERNWMEEMRHLVAECDRIAGTRTLPPKRKPMAETTPAHSLTV